MIDAGRKYYQPSSIERLIRDAAWYKLNTVHLHLTEYNAFRLNSPKFPGLASAQSYTRSDIADFERVAAKYHVTIVPEIDLPAHATAITAYWPETTWDCASMNDERGHDFTLDVTKPATLARVRELLDEFIPWFDGPVFHVGTDEYPVLSTQQRCPELVDYAQRHHVASTSDVMVNFVDYLNSIVRRHGRTTEAWGWWDAAGPPTISPDKNIIVEAYGNETDFDGDVGAEHFLAEGYQVVFADGNQLYVTPGLGLFPDDQALYAAWPAVSNPNLRGYMMSRWSDGTETATDAYQDWYAQRPEVVLADRSWGGAVRGDALDLEDRVDAIGPPPGAPGPTADAVRLTGTVYGSPGSDDAHSAATVYDGNPNTFFDATDADGAYAGIDLGVGSSAVVTKIRFLPRANQPGRMTGGVFEGCADGPTSGCATMATVTWNPATDDWRQVTVSDSTPFRWLRYVAPAGGYGNVAEVEFYRSPDSPASLRIDAPARLRAMGRNIVTVTVTNPTGHALRDVTTHLAVNSVDAGTPLAAAPETGATVSVLPAHGSATRRWRVAVPFGVVPGAYRVSGALSAPDLANASVLSSVAPTLTASVTPSTVTGIAGRPVAATLTLANSAAASLAVRWRAVPPNGITVSPAAGTINVPAGGSVTVRLAATSDSAAPGLTSVPITVTSGRLTLASTVLVLSVPYPDLAGAFNDVGITSDGDVNPADLDGGIDGDGSSYSAQALAAAGAVAGQPFRHNGVSFTWPAAAPGTPDDVNADGQTIDIGKSGSAIGLLACATYVAPSAFAGTVTVDYTDGSTSTFPVTVPEWQRGHTAPADEAIVMDYHNYPPVGQASASTYVYFVGAALDSTKTVASVTLPAAGANRATLHVFAVAVG